MERLRIVTPSKIMLAFWAASLFSMPQESVVGLPPDGIWLGINDIAVAGTRRTTTRPELVTLGLLLLGIRRHQEVRIRKEMLTVKATLTASCISVRLLVLQTGSGSIIYLLSDRSVAVAPTDPSVILSIPSGAFTKPSHCTRSASNNGVQLMRLGGRCMTLGTPASHQRPCQRTVDPPKLCREGKQTLTRSARELVKVSLQHSQDGSLREAES